MIVDHDNQFVVIHIPKTGGSTMKDHFLNHCRFSTDTTQNKVIYTGMRQDGFDTCHISCKEVWEYIDTNKWPHLEKYTWYVVARNPYDRAYSAYQFLKYHHECYHVDYLNDEGVTFTSFLEGLGNGYHPTIHTYPMIHFASIKDIHRLSMNILHTESFDSDFKSFLEIYNFEPQFVNANVFNVNFNDSFRYREHFSDTDIDLVNKIYEDDFKTFGYQML